MHASPSTCRTSLCRFMPPLPSKALETTVTFALLAPSASQDTLHSMHGSLSHRTSAGGVYRLRLPRHVPQGLQCLLESVRIQEGNQMLLCQDGPDLHCNALSSLLAAHVEFSCTHEANAAHRLESSGVVQSGSCKCTPYTAGSKGAQRALCQPWLTHENRPHHGYVTCSPLPEQSILLCLLVQVTSQPADH